MILTNARLVGADGIRVGWLEIEGSRVVAAGDGRPVVGAGGGVVAGGQGRPIGTGSDSRTEGVDLGGRYVAPGFVDMHVHGGGGASFVDDPQTAVDFHRRHGTTTCLASLVTGAVPEMAKQIAALVPLVDDGRLAGVHLEGPFLAAARCGAHDPSLLRPPSPGDVATLLDAGAGAVRMVTIAPELPGALEAIRRIVDGSAVAALGHTDATYDQARAALDAGATVGTHLFNAMRPLHHREPGVITALLDSDVTVELVADNVHVHPALVAWVMRAAAPARVALITDAIAAAGAGDGEYRLGGLDVTVREGVARLAGGGAIAGSTLTQDVALRNAVAAGVPLVDAVAALTSVPARALGLSAGSLEVGSPADLVLLDDDLVVAAVMARGTWIAQHLAA